MENKISQLFLILLLYSFSQNLAYNSEITIIIKSKGFQNVLYNQYIYLPNETIINGIKQQSNKYNYNLSVEYSNITMKWYYQIKDCSYMFNMLANIIKIDLSKFDSSKVTNMKDMFYACTSLTSINFKNFDTSSVVYMGYVFDTCTSLTSVDLSSFNTSAVLDMNAMFDDCHSLISIDLQNFDTSLVTDFNYMFFNNYELKYVNLNNFNVSRVSDMHSMFKNCKSLLYINLNTFKEKSGVNLNNMFDSISNNVTYCINTQLSPNIAAKIGAYSNKNNCSNICFENNYIIFFINKNICRKIICEKYYNYEQAECIDYIPEGYYLSNSKLKIIDKCSLNDFYSGLCYSNNSDVNSKDDLIKNIQNDILNGNIKSILNITEGKINDISIKKGNAFFTITTADNQYNNENKNESSIKLGKCIDELKYNYKLSDNDTLLIFKIDIYEEGLLVPIIEYEVYNLEKNEKLNLTFCKDTKISIELPVNISEKDLFKYNTSSEYYNDICFTYTSEKGTDLSLNDRRKEYSKKNQSLCETNCEYDGYDNKTKKALCECEIKINLPFFSEIVINKDRLIKDLTNIKDLLNIKIIKCYKVLFTKEGIITNIGSYIILAIILIYIISIIVFGFKGYKNLLNRIRIIIGINNKSNKNKTDLIKNDKKNKESKKTNKKNKEKSKTKNDSNNKSKENKNAPTKKTKKEKKIGLKSLNIIQTNGDYNKIHRSKSDLSILNKKNKNKKSLKLSMTKKEINLNKNKNKLFFNDYEMNTLLYKEALKYDKRTYFEYYISLLKTKHLMIFAFYTYNDYNSKIIKICLFFFSFALYYKVNALFFNDSTMNRIYEDDGAYNFIYQIRQIFYSSMICSIGNIIICFFSLTERDILQVKREKKNKDKHFIKLSKFLIIKFSLFFSISIILLILFWYYLSCFCAIYRNTQLHLIKDTLICFGLTMIYPFGWDLRAAAFRIPSLKKSNRECIYKLSQIIQFI